MSDELKPTALDEMPPNGKGSADYILMWYAHHQDTIRAALTCSKKPENVTRPQNVLQNQKNLNTLKDLRTGQANTTNDQGHIARQALSTNKHAATITKAEG